MNEIKPTGKIGKSFYNGVNISAGIGQPILKTPFYTLFVVVVCTMKQLCLSRTLELWLELFESPLSQKTLPAIPLAEPDGLLALEFWQNFNSSKGFTGEIFLPGMCVENQVQGKKMIKPSKKRCSSYKGIFLSFVHAMNLKQESNFNFKAEGTHIRPVQSSP